MADNFAATLLGSVQEQLGKVQRENEYFDNPVLWAEDILGIRLWSKQAEVAMSLIDNHDVAVKAGHEVGKSFLAGLLICWWLDTRLHLPGGAFVVSTAPSLSQINAIVWREVRRFKSLWDKRHEEYLKLKRHGEETGTLPDHPSMGYITSLAHWRLDDGTEIGYGRKPPDTKDDTMSGIHARYVLAIGDEAVGLSEALIGDLRNITSNATSRRFLICNPTNPLSYVGTIFREDTGTWHLETISVLDSPNFHGGEGFPDEVLETLVDEDYVTDMAKDYGENSPEYVSRVLGEFAWDMGLTILTMEDMAVALDLTVIPDPEVMPHLGVDVSRSEKGDMNTIYSYEYGPCYVNNEDHARLEPTGEYGSKRRKVAEMNEKDAMKTARWIHDHALSTAATVVYVDGDGVGGPIADRVREFSEGRYLCIDARGNKPSPDINRWRNARAYWYWNLAEDIRGGRVDIDPEDSILQQELLGIQYKLPDVGAQGILIESKKDMAKRGFKSPDYADGFMYSGINVEQFYENASIGKMTHIDPTEIEMSGFFEGAGFPG